MCWVHRHAGHTHNSAVRCASFPAATPSPSLIDITTDEIFTIHSPRENFVAFVRLLELRSS